MSSELTVRPLTSDAQTIRASNLDARPAVQAGKKADAAQKFESFVLQSFIQELMPETQESVFGSGIAGDFWKSMMAEKIADQVAARGSIGIADYVRKEGTAPVRPSNFNPLDVLSHQPAAGGVASMLATNPVSGE